ncbi:MAG: SDR family NAD(P)-dependent oxidoreductase [Verrucomicrobia bacterium]|nr:SDR family NAD(P)-dependent oxidoreductase [Verrucomicrobiota bacterium]
MSKLGERYARALVTGAGSGLGKAFAEALIGEGIAVWGTSRQPDKLMVSDQFTGVKLDLAENFDLQSWYNRTDTESGGFDLVINNAGFATFGQADKMAATDVEKQVKVLLTGPIQLSVAAIGLMRDRGHGCLVNISSVASELWIPYMPVYNATKAGLSVFSQSMMLEAPDRPPWIIDFRPGDYRTAFNQHMRKHLGDNSSSQRVWQRLQQIMEKSPPPTQAAKDLLSSLRQFRHCTRYSGSFFQSSIAPLASRLFSNALNRGVLRRYFNL